MAGSALSASWPLNSWRRRQTTQELKSIMARAAVCMPLCGNPCDINFFSFLCTFALRPLPIPYSRVPFWHLVGFLQVLSSGLPPLQHGFVACFPPLPPNMHRTCAALSAAYYLVFLLRTVEISSRVSIECIGRRHSPDLSSDRSCIAVSALRSRQVGTIGNTVGILVGRRTADIPACP